MKKDLIKITGILALAGILCAPYSSGTIAGTANANASIVTPNANSTGKLISDVYTDKSRYNPKDSIGTIIELNNKLNKDFKGDVHIFCKYLGNIVTDKIVKLTVKKGAELKQAIPITLPKTDYKGYSIEVYAEDGGKVLDSKNTAADVSSDWSKFPRYGYITNYPTQDKRFSQETIDNLNKYHINGLEFYDWQNQHDKPLAGTVQKPEDSWSDIAERSTSGQTVKDYINLAHSKNMMAANYNLMFGAYNNYAKRGIKPQWGLYKDSKHVTQDFHPLPDSWATNKLYLFNPADKGWQNYIFNAEKEAFKVYNFDVWHVDTLGERGILYDYNGKPIDLLSTYTDFLNNAKKVLGKRVVCNTVNQDGLNEVASGANVDFLYTEVWPPTYSNYYDLKQTIDNGSSYSDGKKTMVLAAYMDYGSANMKAEFNDPGILLTDATIFAAGGSHIELGDTGMLSKEYFPQDYLTMSDSLKQTLRNYYDFSVSYENLLRDNAENTDNNVEVEGIPTSSNGCADTVWAYAKKTKGYEIVHLINLLGTNDSNWRDDEQTRNIPTAKKDIKVCYHLSNTNIKNIWLASPDFNDGGSVKLKYQIKSDANGKYAEISVPKLSYWDMIYIEK